ncbi:MAG: alpha-E domain-containing protein, partial [Nocardioidaceae bacterium]
LSVMGVDDHAGSPDRRTVLDMFAYDPGAAPSIVSTLGAARESARRARETLSTEMWEAINTTWRAIPSGRVRTMRPPQMFSWTRQRAAIIAGIADSTMSRDQSWQFLVLGRSIERVDMTARLLSTAALSNGPKVAWPTTLRACGAYEAFLRTYRGLEADQDAAEFLLLDRLFPRSVVSALTRSERSLENLESAGRRAGFSNEALRMLGRARAELEYRPLSDIVFDLPVEMERLQRSCSAATDAISNRYFSGAVAMSWLGGLR